MIRGLLRILSVCAVAISSLPAADSPDTAVDPAPARKLGVGDRVRYQVREDGDPMVVLEVGNTGTIDLPYYGPIGAVGKTAAQMREEISTALELELYVTASVRLDVIEYRVGALNRGRVHLAGQVRQVGMVEIDLDQQNTLGRVLLSAGGLADFADKRHVRIIRRNERGEPETITVDLREVLDRGRIEKDVELRDGDLVIVDEKLINW